MSALAFTGPHHPYYYAAAVKGLWKELLARPIPELCELTTFLDSRTKMAEVFAMPRSRWICDSSAFSIFTRGLKVSLDDYIRWLDQLFQMFPPEKGAPIWASSLDVIGNPAEGERNHEKMRRALPGLPVVPCYHRGDDIGYLHRMLDAGEERISIGGMAIADEYTDAESLFPFLDSVYREICDKDGRPRIKTHLFGIGAPKAIMRYPCESSDSANWLSPGVFGAILIPKTKRDGSPDWLEPLLKVPISNESELRRKANAHYTSFRPPLQAAIKACITKNGFEPEELAAKSERRNLWNLKMALEVNKALPARERFEHMNAMSFNFLS